MAPEKNKNKGSAVREFSLPARQVTRLRKRANVPGIPMTVQIRNALEGYLQVQPKKEHLLLLEKATERCPTDISNELWGDLEKRKVEIEREQNYKLSLPKQVQIAVELYLREETAKEEALSRLAPDFELTPSPEIPRKEKKPLDPEEEARLRRLIDEAFEQKTSSLFEQLRAAGHDVKLAVPAIMQKTVTVLRSMIVSCGSGLGFDELDNVVQYIGEASQVTITGILATKATPHSFVARANGWSMTDNSAMSIQHGDDILLTPLDEYPRVIKTGTIILAEIEFKDGRVVQTLKAYEKKRLKANNPDYPGFELGPTMRRAEIKAVCRGVLEKVFD